MGKINVYPEIIETDSAKVESKVDLQMTNESIKRLLKIRELLGGKATIVAIGNKAHNILKKEPSKEQLSNNIILKKLLTTRFLSILIIIKTKYNIS